MAHHGPSTSQVFYDTIGHDDSIDYANQVESDNLVSIHRLSLSGLSSGTTCYYAVKSVFPNNGKSLAAVQANFVFTTPTPRTALTYVSPPNGKVPSGEVGVAYSQALVACGGTPDYTWCIEKGCLPCGLLLNASTGVISGTPAKAGTSNITAQVKDKAGATATEALSIRIITGPHVCTASPRNGKASAWSTLFWELVLLVSMCQDSALMPLADWYSFQDGFGFPQRGVRVEL